MGKNSAKILERSLEFYTIRNLIVLVNVPEAHYPGATMDNPQQLKPGFEPTTCGYEAAHVRRTLVIRTAMGNFIVARDDRVRRP